MKNYLKCDNIFTSAKTGYNLNLLFDTIFNLGREISETMIDRKSFYNVNLNKKSESKYRCCSIS